MQTTNIFVLFLFAINVIRVVRNRSQSFQNLELEHSSILILTIPLSTTKMSKSIHEMFAKTFQKAMQNITVRLASTIVASAVMASFKRLSLIYFGTRVLIIAIARLLVNGMMRTLTILYTYVVFMNYSSFIL